MHFVVDPARPRQIDGEVGLDAAGRGADHDDAVGRNTASSTLWVTKTTVLRVAVPDAQQLDLHQLAGLRVERAEGLVHQQDVGLDGERAREPTRCFMPPESWCG